MYGSGGLSVLLVLVFEVETLGTSVSVYSVDGMSAGSRRRKGLFERRQKQNGRQHRVSRPFCFLQYHCRAIQLLPVDRSSTLL
jgi:hypothetical protein